VIASCGRSGVARVEMGRVTGSVSASSSDELSVEEPLEIRLAPPTAGAQPSSVAVTMRTPGNDVDLAAGFLLTEGLIAGADDLERVRRAGRNAVEARLRSGVRPDAAKLDRHSFVSSSCGACGKRSIAAVRVASRYFLVPGEPRVAPEVIHGLPQALRAGQSAFARTGGIHASGLFDPHGRLLKLREDVGRHNALDKLIGSELLAGRIPLADRFVLVSGRVSFELVQKAAIAGVPVLAAVGAPSSLAVDLARECGMTLLGFVRDGRFNVYADFGRIDGSTGRFPFRGTPQLPTPNNAPVCAKPRGAGTRIAIRSSQPRYDRAIAMRTHRKRKEGRRR
jgi:FdhD protein